MMKKHQKILCCCSWGCNRSVHMKLALNLRGFDNVLTLGLEHTDAYATEMLTKWADIILVPEEKLVACIPKDHQFKAKVLAIGPDIWGGWQQTNLMELVELCFEGEYEA